MKALKKFFKSPFFLCSAALLAGLFLRFFVFSFVTVSGTSMEPFFYDGEMVPVLKIKKSTVKKGDVITFSRDGKTVIKRVAGTQNDDMEFLCDKDYNLLLGGKIIPINSNQYTKLKDYKKVPENCVFVLGDNLLESYDSRDYGFVNLSEITGKAIKK